ncbi:MAG: NAD(+) diphosphatase [Nocardioidaceae bacterium]
MVGREQDSSAMPAYPFKSRGHDRAAEHREDPDHLAAAWRRTDTRVLVMRGDELASDDALSALHFVAPHCAPPGERVFLGLAHGQPCFLVVTSDETEQPAGSGRFGNLRQLVPGLDHHEQSLAVHALSLGGWHRRHPRCSVCGAGTEVADAGASRRCPNCGASHFPRTDPAVIMLVVDAADRCLLGHNAARPTGTFSTLAGFVEPGETPEDAVVREVKEEAGVDVEDVRYAGSQPWPFPSSLMLGFTARAVSTDVTVDGEEITEARWFSREDLRREAGAGDVVIPTTISIAGALITRWYGAELPTG